MPRDPLQRVGRDWEFLAREDPLWAILTDPGTRGGRWDPEAFFESGRREVRLLVDMLYERSCLSRSPEELRERGRALDFGCGVGRLSQGLCEHHAEVVGVDISPTMIELAQEHNRHGERCRYVRNGAPHLDVLGDEAFDLCYSFIVLQHMPWTAAKRYLHAMAGRLKPGGLLVFQLPARATQTQEHGPLRRAVRALAPRPLRRWRHHRFGDRLAGRMEMHATPRATVEGLLAGLGLERLVVTENQAAGAGYESWLYVARRP